MVLFHENSPQGWKLENLGQDYAGKVMKAFITVEITNLDLLGKFKLNQDKSIENRSSVISHLLENSGFDVMCGLIMKKVFEDSLVISDINLTYLPIYHLLNKLLNSFDDVFFYLR